MEKIIVIQVPNEQVPSVLWKLRYYYILLCHILHKSIHTFFLNKILLSLIQLQGFIINVRFKEPNV